MLAGSARAFHPRCEAGSVMPVLPTAELCANYPGTGDEGLELREREVTWQPGQAAVGIDPQPIRRHALEHPANSPRDQIGALDVEILQIEHPGAELFRAVELPPELALGHLAIGELEHELVGGHAADCR